MSGRDPYTAAPVKSSVEALEGNKVKVSVEVPEDELEVAVDAAFRKIAREVNIPGFRKGKVPRKVLEARIGLDYARSEAIKDNLGEYYSQAVLEHDVDVIDSPEIDITGGTEDGPLAFDAVVEVRPRIEVVGYDALVATVPSPVVTDEELDAQIEQLRSQFGELEAVERPVHDGDFVTVDIAGSQDGEPVSGLSADDYLYEVGSASVVPELDDELRGRSVADIVLFEAEHPAPGEDATVQFRVLVKEVKVRNLPDLDDAFAEEASEFATLDELRADYRTRLESIKKLQTSMAIQNAVIAALVELVDDDAPEALLNHELEHRLSDFVQTLQNQGIGVADYLAAVGRTGEDITEELRAQSISAVKADLAIRAVIEAESVEVSDAELDEEIARLAAGAELDVEEARGQLEQGGQLESLRSTVQRNKALTFLVEHASLVDEDGNPVDRADLELPQSEAPETEPDDDIEPVSIDGSSTEEPQPTEAASTEEQPA